MRWWLISALLVSAAIIGRVEARPPNVLLIFADDLGWSDTGSYGNPLIETPNIDRLASEGIRFTNAYAAAPICSASRAGLLTGQTPARLGFEFVTKNEPGYQSVDAPLRAPAFTLNLPLQNVTLAEMMGEAGYRTAFLGKWHLNQHHGRYLGWSPTHGPGQHGFSETWDSFGSHPYAYWRKKGERRFLDRAKGDHGEDELTRLAIEFLEEDHTEPFFCMVSHYYVHDPLHTRNRWLLDHYLEKIPATHPRREVMATYAAMVTTLDHLVGRLLLALDESGHRDTTLVCFTSDNGGHPNYAGNAPLRGSKWNLYEGGIRVPLLVRYPGVVIPGTTCEEPVTSLDLYPTFAGLAGGDTSPALDGQSFLPLLRDPDNPPELERSLYWHFPYYHPEKKFAQSPREIGIDDGVTSQTRPHSAIRRGKWKLLWFHEDDRIELFDLGSDPGEGNDLSLVERGVADDLFSDLKAYLKESGARMPAKPNQ